MPSGSGRSSFDDESSVQAPLLPLQSIHDTSEPSSRQTSPTRRHRRSPTHGPTLFRKLLHYTPLHTPQHGRKSVRRRATQCFFILTAVPLSLLVVAVLWWGGIPRSYRDIRRMERALPQHRWGEVKVEYPSGELVSVGRDGMSTKAAWEKDAGEGYLRFPNALWGHGFNNILEERLLAAQLAHLSNRAYVFEDYVWSRIPLPYTLYDFGLRPTRVPINAFLSGFISGANVSSTDTFENPVHLSVSSEYFEYVCPPDLPAEHRVVLYAADSPDFPDGVARINWWVDHIKIHGKGKRCVEIRESKDSKGSRLFDFNFFGSYQQIAPLVPKLIESPVLKHFSWSPLVEGAVKRTISTLGLSTVSRSNTSDTIPGLLAIHLRRGDYSRHCARLAEWHAGYMGFNLADGVKDRLNYEEALEHKPTRKRAKRKVNVGRLLEKRWWYWAGKAGQRLTTSTTDATSLGALSNTHSSSTTKAKVVKTSKHDRPTPVATKTGTKTVGNAKAGTEKKKSDAWQIKKDYDFSRGRMGLNQEIILLDVEPVVEEPSEEKVEEKQPAKAVGGNDGKWMWWGGGSKKGSKQKKHEAHLEDEDEDEDEVVLDEDDIAIEEELNALDTRDYREARDGTLALHRRDEREEAIKAYYFTHCLPTTPEIVHRASEVRSDWMRSHPSQPLSRILLLSNGWPSWLLSLAEALRKDGWEVVDPDESIRQGMGKLKDVDVAVDMALAQKAEVFLGNGFSTLSGNVILFRMGEGVEADGNRLL